MFQDPRRPAIYALSPEDQGILDLLHTREKEAAKEAYRMVERAVEEGTEEDWAIMEWYKETVHVRYSKYIKLRGGRSRVKGGVP